MHLKVPFPTQSVLLVNTERKADSTRSLVYSSVASFVLRAIRRIPIYNQIVASKLSKIILIAPFWTRAQSNLEAWRDLSRYRTPICHFGLDIFTSSVNFQGASSFFSTARHAYTCRCAVIVYATSTSGMPVDAGTARRGTWRAASSVGSVFTHSPNAMSSSIARVAGGLDVLFGGVRAGGAKVVEQCDARHPLVARAPLDLRLVHDENRNVRFCLLV
ncbi:hypothetical protein B0H11DRAFT_1917746 [Mycena galericulata]|nr:hypothetical protein B0H11DRAFT_1917746 [Mycena galericulata]